MIPFPEEETMSDTIEDFGSQVLREAAALKESGKDPNQTANILCQKDAAGSNYGIGIVLGGDGRPAPSSPTLLSLLRAELELSGSGSYMSSAKLMEELKTQVLRWQRIPEEHLGDFLLAVPSDAGTGAVFSAVLLAAMSRPVKTLAAEKLGWPAEKAIAKAARLGYEEFSSPEAAGGRDVLAVYQAGPLNSTGAVPPAEAIENRAARAADSGAAAVLDRAYSGFEFAGDLASSGYDAVMRRSYELHLAPFLRRKASFFLALSPTKTFVSFALRPCGMLLVHEPDPGKRAALEGLLAPLIRARGSSFEHAVTRAFVKAMCAERGALEAEHEGVLRRVAQAEAQWRELAAGTALEPFFSDGYAGIFRNFRCAPEAPERIYGAHLYPVFLGDRCRLNVTGLPFDPEKARTHVRTFAGICLG